MPSVLTVTVNPAIDVSTSVDQMLPDHKLRSGAWAREAGGGGVNVARVLKRLGVTVRPFVVAGGITGELLIDMVRSEGLDGEVFRTDGVTRESFAVTEASTGRQYRITAPGPAFDDQEGLIEAVQASAVGADVVVLSGSLCPGMSDDFYARVLARLDPSTTTIVDTKGPALAATTAAPVSVIKPSQRELAAMVGWDPSTRDDVERAANEVLRAGTVGALIASRGPAGALLARPGEAPIWFHPPPVRPVSSVGAGDSMVAGIAAELVRGHSIIDAARFGVAAGTAAVLTAGSALCEVADVERLVGQVLRSER